MEKMPDPKPSPRREEEIRQAWEKLAQVIGRLLARRWMQEQNKKEEKP